MLNTVDTSAAADNNIAVDMPIQTKPKRQRYKPRKVESRVKVDGDDGLREKQRIFCLEYARTGNITQSYIKAGYSVRNGIIACSNGKALLENPKIDARVRELRAQIRGEENKKIMDAREVRERLTALARMTVKEEQINSKTGEIVELRVPSRSALDAMKLLSKLEGWLVNKSELKVAGSVPVVISDDVKE